MNDGIRTDVQYAIRQLRMGLEARTFSILEDCSQRALDALESVLDALETVARCECGEELVEVDGELLCPECDEATVGEEEAAARCLAKWKEVWGFEGYDRWTTTQR